MEESNAEEIKGSEDRGKRPRDSLNPPDLFIPDQLSLLHLARQLSSHLTQAQVLDDALPSILRSLCRALPASVSAFWERLPKTDLLQCRSYHSLNRSRYSAFELVTRDLRLVPGDDVIGRVWAGGQSQVIDVAIDPTFRRALAARRSGLPRGLAFPLLDDQQATRAVIECYGSYPLSAEQQAVLELTATYLVQFIRRLDAEAARRRSEEQLSLVVSSTPVILYTTDQNGHLTSIEGRALHELGLMPGDGLGQPIARALAALPQMVMATYDALRTGSARTVQCRYKALLLATSIVPGFEQGQVMGVSGVTTVYPGDLFAEGVLSPTPGQP